MIAIGADHAGFMAKEKIKRYLSLQGNIVKDFGTFEEESCDYPVAAKLVAQSVASGVCEKGVLICGTGIGMAIAANKIRGIRAAVCYNEHLAQVARSHNNINVLCLGARITNIEEFEEIVEAFLNTEFGNGRHELRIQQILEMESKEEGEYENGI